MRSLRQSAIKVGSEKGKWVICGRWGYYLKVIIRNKSKKDVILVVKRILKCGDVKPKITTMACRDDDNFDNQKTKM